MFSKLKKLEFDNLVTVLITNIDISNKITSQQNIYNAKNNIFISSQCIFHEQKNISNDDEIFTIKALKSIVLLTKQANKSENCFYIIQKNMMLKPVQHLKNRILYRYFIESEQCKGTIFYCKSKTTNYTWKSHTIDVYSYIDLYNRVQIVRSEMNHHFNKIRKMLVINNKLITNNNNNNNNVAMVIDDDNKVYNTRKRARSTSTIIEKEQNPKRV